MSRFITIAIPPRRQVCFMTVSNPALAVPAWAVGRVAYVTGCAGGGSAVNAALYGGAGAFALRHPILLPVGVAAIEVQIGAAGLSGDGGDTKILAGTTRLLVLKGGAAAGAGGLAGSSYSTSDAGNSLFARFNNSVGSSNNLLFGGIAVAAMAQRGATLFSGSDGFQNPRSDSESGWGPVWNARGGSGPFGVGGDSGVIAATGYGAGAAQAKPARPGFLMIEFEEAI